MHITTRNLFRRNHCEVVFIHYLGTVFTTLELNFRLYGCANYEYAMHFLNKKNIYFDCFIHLHLKAQLRLILHLMFLLIYNLILIDYTAFWMSMLNFMFVEQMQLSVSDYQSCLSFLLTFELRLWERLAGL